MRFLVDMPLSRALAQWLTCQGHEAIHASDVGLQRAPDTELVARAKSAGSVIMTADLDYQSILVVERDRVRRRRLPIEK